MITLGYIDDANYHLFVKEIKLGFEDLPDLSDPAEKRKVLQVDLKRKLGKALKDMLDIVNSRTNGDPGKLRHFQADCRGEHCPGNATICTFARLASILGPLIARLFPEKKIIGIEFSQGQLV